MQPFESADGASKSSTVSVTLKLCSPGVQPIGGSAADLASQVGSRTLHSFFQCIQCVYSVAITLSYLETFELVCILFEQQDLYQFISRGVTFGWSNQLKYCPLCLCPTALQHFAGHRLFGEAV